MSTPPVVVVVDDHPELRHVLRDELAVEGEGLLQTLECRYHGGWRSDLDGCMRFMPEFEDSEDFPSPSDDLPSLPLHEWGPLFFASLDPMFEFEEWIHLLRERVDWLQQERFTLYESCSSDYLISANWVLYCD